VDVSSGEKIYISLVKRERARDEANVETIESIRERRERESHEIYKSCNSVIKPTLNTTESKHKSESIKPYSRRSYRKNAIRDRCRQFAQDFYDHGFHEGVKLNKYDLRYWIIALDLAHDKIAVRQYLERLVMFGYFHLHKNGFYEFVRRLPEGQVTLLDPKIVRLKLNASLRPLKRVRKSF